MTLSNNTFTCNSERCEGCQAKRRVRDPYTACSIVEGFDHDEHTLLEELYAWAYLIETGQCWRLQGWYGRQAQSIIDAGYITADGKPTKSGLALAGA